MKNNTRFPSGAQVANPLVSEILIFDIADRPTFMLDHGRLWISLTTLWPALGALEQAVLLTGELKVLLNDSDGGTYAPFDDFVSVCPVELRPGLQETKAKCLAMARDEKAVR